MTAPRSLEELIDTLPLPDKARLFAIAEKEGMTPVESMRKILRDAARRPQNPEECRRIIADLNEELADHLLEGKALAKSILG